MPLWLLNLITTSHASKLAMARNLTTPHFAPSWLRMAWFFASPAPTLHNKNGRTERAFCTLNDSMHTMILHASASSTFWLDALATATLLNHHPSRVRNNCTPYQLLLGTPPDYDHLLVFGCLFYPNNTATAAHKPTSCSVPCIFLGYPSDTKSYRCYDPK
jgi:hypothetical protein